MQILSRIGRVVGIARSSLLAEGLLHFVIGLASVKWIAIAVATVGGGPVAHLAAVTTIGSAIVLGAMFAELCSRLKVGRSLVSLLVTMLVVTGLAATDWLPLLGQRVLSGASDELLQSGAQHFVLLLKAFASMLSVPAFVLGVALFSSTRPQVAESIRSNPAKTIAGRLLLMGFGLATAGIALCGEWGRSSATTIVLVTSTSALIAAILRVVLEWKSASPSLIQAERAAVASSDEARLPVDPTKTAHAVAPLSSQLVTELLAAALPGFAFVALSRLSDQLMIATLWATTAKWASVCIGLALGMLISDRRSNAARVWSGAVATVTCCWPIALFGTLVGLCLNWSTFVESTSLQVALRCGLLFAMFAPLGIWLSSAVSKLSCGESRSSNSGTPALQLVGFVCGYAVAASMGLASFGVQGVLLVAASGAVFVTLCQSMLRDRIANADGSTLSALLQRAARREMLPVGAALLVLAVMPLTANRYRPEVAARLLFDSRVFVAHRVEQRSDILAHLDEARSVAIHETGSGTLTQWRLGGPRVQLRQSGVLTATHSLDAERTPQVASEALLATLPLVLHERPNHVAVLGLRSGLAVESALKFPVQTLTCIEADSELSRVVQRDVWPQLVANPAEDDRLKLLNVEPALALAAKAGAFDLIISNADQAVLAREAAAYTVESYQRAGRALAPGGLFCQRIAVADIGQETVAVVLATWQRAFEEVTVIETSIGEWLLVGANSETVDPDVLNERLIVGEQSLCLRRGLIERLQRPHVRHALAAIGADWASPLLLSTMVLKTPHESAAGTAAPQGTSSPVTINAARHPLLMARLPLDVLRWGNKLNEINAAYGPQIQTLAMRLGAEAEAEEVTRRITELALQQQIVAQHPDEYWAYRKTMKKRLTEAPYSTIIQVKGERPKKELHPSEKRRLSYIETLGAAAKSTPPSIEQLAAVAAFAEPHDPLVSPFLHQELAELASRRPADRADDEEPSKIAIEWSHRLRTINFGDANDRSVRNVVAAIELLVKHPELIPNDADRGDQLDALCQSLHARWHARGDISPQSSQVMLSDLEHSIAAIDLAFDELDRLREARSLQRPDWDARRTALEKSLVRPLRQYRQLLESHRSQAPSAKTAG